MKSKQYAARRTQRALPAYLCAIAVALVSLSAIALGEQALGETPADVLSRASVLRDPDIPSLGNPNGDLTIVEFFDYQCPFCKKLAPELAKLVQDDGNLRIVLKDWPIFGEVSVSAAKLALATQYQNKYAEAYKALIGANGKLTVAIVNDILAKAGIDVPAAESDLKVHQKTMDDLLARNSAQAEAFGFQGTPGFIVGTFRVPGVLEMKVFKQVIADARAAAKKR
jgi:protein-disulfide isomerase